jgi:hypothetical protein
MVRLQAQSLCSSVEQHHLGAVPHTIHCCFPALLPDLALTGVTN